MARKLASIQIIKDLQPIANADAIEVATVLGWKCVVKKGEFKVGDKCIYIEIDSILPDIPEFEFLKKNKLRVRTVRLRGQVSQGLALPISYLPNITDKDVIEEGGDVTERMKIVQWIPNIPANLAGTVKGTFPSFIPKTDETRVQVLQGVLDRHKGNICYITEKIDGSSVTYFVKDGEFGVCSRNLELKETEDNLYWKMARLLNIEEKLKSLDANIAIQGELYGVGVQGNPLRIPENRVAFFNAFNIDKYEYYDFAEFFMIMERLRLDTVPILGSMHVLEESIDELVQMSIGKSKINDKVWREGIVVRPIVEKMDLEMSNSWGNGRVSFKVINPEYLLEVQE